jgi:hypothetical protein
MMKKPTIIISKLHKVITKFKICKLMKKMQKGKRMKKIHCIY